MTSFYWSFVNSSPMVLLSSHSLLLLVIPLLYISISLLLLINTGFTILFVCLFLMGFFFFFSFFFEGVEYQVLTNSDSTTKLIDIAALLGKSMGMWHACVCSFMFHRVLENGFFFFLGGIFSCFWF